ncbi:MAG: hypothetical protein AAGA56_03445 [Myxococcota bacterium]
MTQSKTSLTPFPRGSALVKGAAATVTAIGVVVACGSETEIVDQDGGVGGGAATETVVAPQDPPVNTGGAFVAPQAPPPQPPPPQPAPQPGPGGSPP